MRLAVERLEDRVLLAASIKGKNLVVDGTDAADAIVIRWTGTPGEVEVSFDNGVTFGGPFSGFQNIKANLKGGDDFLDIQDSVTISGNLSVKLGDGDDVLNLSGSFGGNVKLDLGDGDDGVFESGGVVPSAPGDGNLAVGKNLTLKGGDGDDEYDPHQDITVGGNLKIDMGDGDDRVANHAGVYTYHGRRISVKMGDGDDDELDLGGVITANNARVTLDGGDGSSDELFTFAGNTFGKTPKVKNFEVVGEVMQQNSFA
jgi:hypothetical protein